jgi:hypothetical protein
MAWERISGIGVPEDGPEWYLHVSRYRWASGWTQAGDMVVDAACGTGYGQRYLKGHYVGVDRRLPDELKGRPKSGTRFVEADLTQWDPGFGFDVWVGLETIEHLTGVEHYVEMAKRARRFICISTPIVPTTHFNEHHLRDFTEAEVTALFQDDEWHVFDVLHQQGGVYGLFTFARG